MFQRTNEAGIECFGSYSGKVGAQSIDWLLKFGSMLLLAAEGLMLSYLHIDTAVGCSLLQYLLMFFIFVLALDTQARGSVSSTKKARRPLVRWQ